MHLARGPHFPTWVPDAPPKDNPKASFVKCGGQFPNLFGKVAFLMHLA